MAKIKLVDLVEKRGHIILNENLSIKEAFAQWKRLEAPAKVSYHIYVTDDNNKLVGLLELRELLLEDQNELLKNAMRKDFGFMLEKNSLSHAISLAVEKGLSEVPLVSAQGEMLGVIPTERLLDALNWISTKNIYAVTGILKSMEDVTINWRAVLDMFKARFVWLFIAVLVGVFVSANIIRNFETAIVSVPAIIFFIPVLMDFGGNVGTQTSTIFVSFLVKEESAIKRHLLKLFLVNLLTGALLGIVLGGVAALSAMLFFTHYTLALALFVSLVIISVLAVVVGFAIPFACYKLNLDPAAISSPIVTTIKDVLGLSIYFFFVWLFVGVP